MDKVTIIITTYNEEKNIGACLVNASWADAVMVVDARSTDSTRKIGERHGAKIYDYDHPDRYHEKQLVFGLERATTEWVLALDADERLSPELVEEIKAIMVDSGGNAGYRIPFLNYFFGRPIRHGGLGGTMLMRLYRREHAHYPQGGFVHEQMEVRGNCARCRHPIHHYGTTDLSHYLEKINFYSTLTARKLYTLGKRVSLYNTPVCFIVKPAYYFLLRYIARKGFLDGTDGLVIAFMSAITVMLNHLKLWEIQVASEKRCK